MSPVLSWIVMWWLFAMILLTLFLMGGNEGRR